MTQFTLDSLAKRVEALENALAARSVRTKDWRRVIGMFQDSEFVRDVDEECMRMREKDPEADRDGDI